DRVADRVDADEHQNGHRHHHQCCLQQALDDEADHYSPATSAPSRATDRAFFAPLRHLPAMKSCGGDQVKVSSTTFASSTESCSRSGGLRARSMSSCIWMKKGRASS